MKSHTGDFYHNNLFNLNPIINKMAKEEDYSPNQSKLVENIDYYLNDQGFMVFTEQYHLKRGYCCENNCKHCPYEENKNK